MPIEYNDCGRISYKQLHFDLSDRVKAAQTAVDAASFVIRIRTIGLRIRTLLFSSIFQRSGLQDTNKKSIFYLSFFLLFSVCTLT
jgi:hypothetical protein